MSLRVFFRRQGNVLSISTTYVARPQLDVSEDEIADAEPQSGSAS